MKYRLSFLLLSLTTMLFANESEYYFYHGLDYGSESIIHPVRLILNGGYGIMQADNRPNYPFDIHYQKSWNNVADNLKSPIKAIEEYGWDRFFKTEILPFSIDNSEAYYWPNYTMHLVGGGMSFRMMEEWFRYNNFKFPKLHAFTTLSIYHLLNEVVENGDYVGYNVDPVVDVYIFNPLGMILFSSDRVASFFSHTLNMADWSYQIAYNPNDRSILNNGQNFALKYKFNDKVGLFYYYGNHGELGFSFFQPDGDCYSFGAGLASKSLAEFDSDVRTLKANLILSWGVFWDRNNSLLASFLYSKSHDYKYRLNVYPGVLRFSGFSPGFFTSVNHQDKFIFGLNLRILPFGLGG